jgi:hypothetical protein
VATQLLEYDSRFDAAEPSPALLLGNQNSEDPEISESTPRRSVAESPHALGEPPDGQRVAAECPNRFLQLGLIIRESKFHFRGSVSVVEDI